MNAKRITHFRDFNNRPYWFKLVNSAWRVTYPMGTRPVLDMDDLIRNARKMTGLKHLGSDFWEEPLQRLLGSIREEARLHPIGYFITRQRLLNLLAARLRAEDLFRQHPGILEQPLYPVTVIIGLQRTGTTKLQRLLSADPDNRVLRSWEAINPAPLQADFREKDKRVGIARTSEKALKIMAPGFFAIHPVEHTAPEEDILLLDLTFLSTTPEATMHVPSYASWLETIDQSYAYEYGAKLLKLLQWQHPGRRWILKSPHHLEFLPLVEKYYGPVRFLWTHRDLHECIPSFMSMVSHSRVIFSDRVDPGDVARHWVRKTGYMLNKALEYRNMDGNDSKFTDILYSEFVVDSISQISRVYEKLSPGHNIDKQVFMEADNMNPQGKYGIHRYRLEDFGLNEQDLVRHSGKYLQYFDHLVGPASPKK